VEVTGPNRDLHSGLYGGAVANPINILAKWSLRFMTKTIILPFLVLWQCRRIISWRKSWNGKSPFSLENIKKSTRPKDVYGEKAMWLTRNSIRPTLDVNGIWLYWCRSKTVIASQAFAKISMRLVPNQEWNTSLNCSQTFQEYRPDSVTVLPTSRRSGLCDLYWQHRLQGRTWLIRRLLSSGYSCSFWRKYSYCSFVWKELKAKQS
jgi:hypothetical protein